MFTDGTGSNHLAIIVDSRTESDKAIGGVLRYWGFGAQCLGRTEWGRTLRIAVRDHKEPPLSKKKLPKSSELWQLLKARGISALIVLAAPPPPRGQQEKNNAWTVATGRTDNPYGWAGTVELIDGIYVCPILNPLGWEWAYHWLIRRWFERALAVARGKIAPREWPSDFFWTSDYVSLDIETSKDQSILSFIGIGGPNGALSVPWDEYQIAGTDRIQAGRSKLEEEFVRSILAERTPKVGHNLSFDVYQLRKRGIEVNGDIHDTLLLARTVYPQYARGLQQACAIEMCIEPWKKLYKAPKVKAGLDKWIADPAGTQRYNRKDVIATAWLWESLYAKISGT